MVSSSIEISYNKNETSPLLNFASHDSLKYHTFLKFIEQSYKIILKKFIDFTSRIISKYYLDSQIKYQMAYLMNSQGPSFREAIYVT